MTWSATTRVLSIVAGLAIVLLVAATQNGEANGQAMKVPDNADYTKFEHGSSYHARLPCLLCHKRENNSATLAWPGKSNHLPCAGCHQKQFADKASPI